MTQISNFVQVRTDGKHVPAGMTTAEMLALGWTPSKVLALQWNAEGRAINAAGPYGIHGIVVAGGNFVAAIVDAEASATNTQLEIRSPDGSVHACLENSVAALGREFKGCFQWFEPAVHPGIDKFDAVFQTEAEGAFRCEIDALEARVLSVVRTR